MWPESLIDESRTEGNERIELLTSDISLLTTTDSQILPPAVNSPTTVKFPSIISKVNYAEKVHVDKNSKEKKQLSPRTLEKFASMSLNAARVSTAQLRSRVVPRVGTGVTSKNDEIAALSLAIKTLIDTSWKREAERQKEVSEEISKIEIKRELRRRQKEESDGDGGGGKGDHPDDKIYLSYLKLQHRIERSKEEEVGRRLDERLKAIDEEIDVSEIVSKYCM
mgnify:FL=1